MKKLKENGFSLIGVIVAMGMIGGLSVVVMKLTQNTMNLRSQALSSADEVELRSEIKMILDNPNFCRISLAGDGALGTPTHPIQFKKEQIDEEGEGLNISLYLSNPAGTLRTKKKFNGSNYKDDPNVNGDPDKSKYGKITITSMKLLLNNGAPTARYGIGTHSDYGEIHITISKKLSKNKIRNIKLKPFAIMVGMDTYRRHGLFGPKKTKILSCGPLPNSNTASSFTETLTIHSQTSSNPNCPSGWTRLWNGYSFFYGAGGQQEIFGTDLGKTGSCLRKFIPIPFTECQNPNTCDYFTPNDYGYWLTNRTIDEFAVTGAAMKSRISRCSVCEGTKKIMTIHSQTGTVPSCPSGWTSTWSGYSFFAGAGGHGEMIGTDLGGTGSCLKKFIPIPLIECESTNKCDYYTANDFGYWLTNRTTDESPVHGATMKSKISRCNVCSKN